MDGLGFSKPVTAVGTSKTPARDNTGLPLGYNHPCAEGKGCLPQEMQIEVGVTSQDTLVSCPYLSCQT